MTFRNPVRAVTATIAGGSTGPSIRVRASLAVVVSSFSGTVTVPSSVQAGDLLVASFSDARMGFSGWNTVGTAQGFKIMSKVAVAGDAGSSLANPSSGVQGTLVLLALAGASTFALQSDGTGSAPTLTSGTVASGACLIGFMNTGTDTTGGAWAWGSTIQGGPPTPPSWSNLAIANTNAGSQVAGLSFANWSPAAAYNAAPARSNGVAVTAVLGLAA